MDVDPPVQPSRPSFAVVIPKLPARRPRYPSESDTSSSDPLLVTGRPMARPAQDARKGTEEGSDDEIVVVDRPRRRLVRGRNDSDEDVPDSQPDGDEEGSSTSGPPGAEDEDDSSEEDMDETEDYRSGMPSPRKTRSRTRASAPVSKSTSRNSESEPLQQTGVRRSGREKATKISYAMLEGDGEDADEDDELAIGTEDREIAPRRQPKRAIRREGPTGAETLKVKRNGARPPGSSQTEEGVDDDGERYRDAHRPFCGRCGELWSPDMPELVAKALRKGSNGRMRANNPLQRFQSVEEVYDLGCWIECEQCTECHHFGCLMGDLRTEIRRELKQRRDEALARVAKLKEEGKVEEAEAVEVPEDKMERDPALKLLHRCNYCWRPGQPKCMVCKKGPKTKPAEGPAVHGDGIVMDSDKVPNSQEAQKDEPFMFRCAGCHRAAHYSCLPSPVDDASDDDGEESLDDVDEKARIYQSGHHWCGDCEIWEDSKIECILAWRPASSPDNEREPMHGAVAETTADRSPSRRVAVKLPDPKSPTEEAEYLCKFEKRYFGDTAWIPHSYMVAKVPAKLRNFLSKGPGVDLQRFGASEEDGGEPSQPDFELPFGLAPDPDAQNKVPKAWLTPDRILSINLEYKGESRNIIDFKESRIPSDIKDVYETVSDAYIVWQDMPLEHATWTAKFERDSPYFAAFIAALDRFLRFRKFVVPKPNPRAIAELDSKRTETSFKALEKQPGFIPHELFPFQLDGLNFCYFNWWRQHPTILADEMGLGKTVQICSFISVLSNRERRMPFLIVVPNSTVQNWARECAKWIPDLKTVTITGTSAARAITERYELFPLGGNDMAAHVVVATYNAAEKATSLLNRVPRWEAIIVDEGQRLKSGDKGGLFRSLTSLKSAHRILMSGTPLNNNLRELFNLLSFLDPVNYPKSSLDDLERRYEELTPELIDELRNTIRPYMLRRTKDTALDLPKLSEIIVPISMRPLQKQVYKGILTRNVGDITAIYSKKKSKSGPARFQNILMELRKDLGHPYLNDPLIEPREVTDEQAHRNLVEASGKLVFLQKFLPKLKERGHRTLIFSQFRIFLDILERFFEGERVRFLRLDGTTSQMDRQAAIDAFNREGSDYDVFMLSTRAGGAGINLYSADTVIIADPDWNPHNDLQAISRAHRYGQKKPVNVFKLMCKGSAEEKIVQTGKKKLVLDHLVIQKASEEETEAADIENILQFGAQELFAESDEALGRDIRYTDQEIDELLIRTHDEANAGPDTEAKADKTFAFARVWESSKGGLAEIDDGPGADAEEQRGFWDRLLQKTETEALARQLAEEAAMGRGARKRRAVDYQDGGFLETPQAGKSKKRKGEPEDGDFEGEKVAGQTGSSSEDEKIEGMDPDDLDLYNKSKEEKAREKAARKADRIARRKAKAERRAAREARAAAAAEAAAAAAGQAQEGSRFGVPSGGQDERFFDKPVAGLVKPILPPDVVNRTASERQTFRDEALRQLQQKAKTLRNSALDQLLDTVRELGAKEQTKRLMQATMLIQDLTEERIALRQRQAALLVPGQRPQANGSGSGLENGVPGPSVPRP